MPGVYGGDEINAVVIDAGHANTRSGWAGEDTPRVVIPSHYGYLDIDDDELARLEAQAAFDPSSSSSSSSSSSLLVSASNNDAEAKEAADVDGDESMADHPPTPLNRRLSSSSSPSSMVNGTLTQDSDLRLKWTQSRAAKKTLMLIDRTNKRKRYMGDNDVNLWRAGMEIGTPFDQDGIVSDFSAFQSLCNYSLDRLSCNPTEHPLIMTEPAWNSKEAREKMTEIAFESIQTPAFYLANRTVLSSFAAGKPTSLVVDIGASSISVIPVVDGFILRKGIQRQDNAGNAVSKALLYSLQNQRTNHFAGITPSFLIKSKTAVDPAAPPQFQLRQDRLNATSSSFRNYHDLGVLDDFKESTGHVIDLPWDENQARLRPTKQYEFPDGYNDLFGVERYKASEIIFTPSVWSSSSSSSGILNASKNYDSLSQMIINAINSTDVDSRPSLFSNIVCVGGSTFLPGLVDRLSYELGILAPNQKVKIHSPGNSTERRHSSWLGASILASLGTFHQLWISKQEYDEHGSTIVHARCK